MNTYDHLHNLDVLNTMIRDIENRIAFYESEKRKIEEIRASEIVRQYDDLRRKGIAIFPYGLPHGKRLTFYHDNGDNQPVFRLLLDNGYTVSVVAEIDRTGDITYGVMYLLPDDESDDLKQTILDDAEIINAGMTYTAMRDAVKLIAAL